MTIRVGDIVKLHTNTPSIVVPYECPYVEVVGIRHNVLAVEVWPTGRNTCVRQYVSDYNVTEVEQL